MRVSVLGTIAALLLMAGTGEAQLLPPAWASFKLLNKHLAGQVVDYTDNHGHDRRVPSPILGTSRDLYVYLPPGYDPGQVYPLLMYFHLATVDERYALAAGQLVVLDEMIQAGVIPPVIVAIPDGTISGRSGLLSPHSFFVNGVNGAFSDHIVQEVIPFVLERYPIRPEREAHALLGTSAGGYGALVLAITHRHFFGAVATLSAPANLMYGNVDGDVLEDFDPATYRWHTGYDPNEVIYRGFFGLYRQRAKSFIRPVFGETASEVVPRVTATNPATLIDGTGLQPGELAIFLGYGERDGFNFDAHAESFAWLAAQRGIDVTLDPDPRGQHNRFYFRRSHPAAFAWLGQHLLPPAPRADGAVYVTP